jgi:hypothetical protein
MKIAAMPGGAFQFIGNHKVRLRMLNKGEEDIIRRKGRAGGIGVKQEEMRGKLEEMFRERMEEFVEWKGEERAYTFEEIEEEALVIGRALVREMIGVAVVEEGVKEERHRARPEPNCEGCERPMRYSGRRGRRIDSKVGGVRIERAYYHCPSCKVGFFPPGPKAEDRRGTLEQKPTAGRGLDGSQNRVVRSRG